MADEDVTREVLFPDWEGPDKTGLTIEHASTGEMFVKEVKGESPAARSGQVHEGDQIVGATIYFDNMSTEEKTDLMKVLARHKVGLKLQNKADKSPCYSPLSTPCRSPMGTLTWEGRTSFGGSSPDIVLSGDDEDYRRIYTKKIKPRLKSEDLAEGVDVRTERHSSTSSDGSTITTITRRITTYTVDVPSDISEKLELSSPDLKRLQHESGDSSPSITILRGNLSSRVGAEEGVFDSSDLSYTGPGEVETRTVIRDGKQKCSDVGYKGLASRVTDSEMPEIFRVSAEQEGESILISKKSMTQSDSTMTGNSHMTIGRSEVAETTLGAKNGASGSWSIREKDMQIGISTKGKTNMGGFKGIFDEKTKVSTSENVISNTESKQAGTSDVKLGGTSGNGTDLRLLRSGTDLNTIHLEYSSKSGTISDTGKNIDFKSYNQTVNLPSAQEERKVSGNVTNIWDTETDKTVSGTKSTTIKVTSVGMKEIRKDEKMLEGKLGGEADVSKPGVKVEVSGKHVNTEMKEGDINIPYKDIEIHEKSNKDLNKRTDTDIPRFKIPSFGTKSQKEEEKDSCVQIPVANINVKDAGVNIMKSDLERENEDTKKTSKEFNVTKSSGKQSLVSDIESNLKASNLQVEKETSTKVPNEMQKKTKESFNVKTSEVKMSEFDIQLKQPKIVEDLNGGVAKGKENIKASTKGSEVTNKEPKGPKFKIPSFSKSFPGNQELNVEVTLKEENKKRQAHNIEGIGGGVCVETPETPDLGIGGAELDIEGAKGGFKMPKFKMPTFGSKGHKLEGPDVDVNLPSADMKVKAPEVDIAAPDVDIEGPDAKFKGPKFNMPKMPGMNVSMPDVDFNLKGPKVKGDIETSLPKIEGDIKTPNIDIKGPDVNIDGTKAGFEMPKVKMPSLNIKGPKMEKPEFDLKLKGPKVGGDLDVKIPKIEGDIKAAGVSGSNVSLPDVDVGRKVPETQADFKGSCQFPNIDIKGSEVSSEIPEISTKKMKFKMPKIGFKGSKTKVSESNLKSDIDVDSSVDLKGRNERLKMPKFKMPSFEEKGLQFEESEVDVNLPKSRIDIEHNEKDIKGIGIDISPSGKIQRPKFSMPDLSESKVSMHDLDLNLKSPKSEFEGDMPVPKLEGKITAPEVNLEMSKSRSKIGGNIDDISANASMSKFVNKSLELEGPEPKIKTPAVSVGAKGSTTDVGFQQSEVSVDTPDTDINVKGKKGKFKIAKVKGKAKKADTKVLATDLGEDTSHIHVKETKTKKSLFGKIHFPDVELDMKSPKMKGDGTLAEGVKSSKTDLVSAGLNTSFDCSGTAGANVGLEGPDVKVSSSATSGSGGGLRYPEGKLTFSKIRVPKFGIVKADFEGLDSDNKVESEVLSGGDINTQSQSASHKVSSHNIAIQSPELSHSEGKIKLKMPKFFGKSKVKGSTDDLRGTDVELGASGQVHKASTELCAPSYDGGNLEMEGTTGLTLSSKSKSASLDLFKNPRHRSSSHSDEGSPATSSPTLEAEACDVSLDLGVNKVKGKKSKLKFGTFGGFGSKSKGSYEVTLGGENEAGMEGSSSVSTPSKKSRLSSSSSSDSGSRAGLKFPKLELSVSPKK